MSQTTTAPPLPGLLYAQAAEYQDRLVALEDQAAAAMEQAWETARVAIQGDLDQLMARVEQARAKGEPMSPSWPMREARYRQALVTVDEQVAQYAQTAARLAGAAQGRALELATTAAASLGSAAVTEAGVAATFQAVNPANLQHLVGFLQDGTPLADLFATLGPDAVAGARQVFTHGIVLGRGVDRIARDLRQVVDVPRWRSVTIARTESHRVFREASRQTYAQNADVLEGWTWTAHLDSRCCPGCVAMHGTQHAVTDQLDGHPRCRCAMVPRTKSWRDLLGDDTLPDTRPTIGRGTDWLRDQPARVQRAVLGPGKFAAWRAGDVDLEDLVHRFTDSRWGTMRRESTLAEAKTAAVARKRAAATPARAPRKRAAVPATPATEWQALDRDAILARYGGTPLANKAAAAIREVHVRGPHSVVVEVPMTAAQRAALLDDVQTVTGQIAGPLGDAPVEFRVPAKDRKFSTRGRSTIGAYVTQGTRTVNLNPKVAKGELDNLTPEQFAQFMPGAAQVGFRRWTITHELGHVVDGSHHHTWEPGGRTPSGFELPNTTRDEANALSRDHRDALSTYGRTKPGEAYAEVFAEWVHGSSSPVVEDYARRYGWTR